MFNSITAAYKILTNLSKIQAVISTVFIAIVKTTDILEYITAKISDTALKDSVDKYIPVVISTLKKIKDIISKYSSLIGVNLNEVSVQNADNLEALKQVNTSLDELLK